MEAVELAHVKLSVPANMVNDNLSPVVNDRLCCCSVFVWTKVLAVLSAASTASLLVPAIVQATGGNYFWLAGAVPAVLLSIVILLNVFYWHRWIVYALFSVWLGATAAFLGHITFLAMLIFGYGVAKSCFDHPSCPDNLTYFFAVSTVLIAALSITVFAFAVVCKAAQCQKRLDGPSILPVREQLTGIEWTLAGVTIVVMVILSLVAMLLGVLAVIAALFFVGYGLPRA